SYPSGGSRYSDDGVVTTPAPLPDAAPTNLAGTSVSTTQINLTWTDNSTNETGFRVERVSGTSWTVVATLGANVTSYSNTGLTAGTTYTYQVAAYNAAGSRYSESTQATTQ